MTQSVERKPACLGARVPLGEVSPWKHLVDYYFGRTDLAARVVDQGWGKADFYWDTAYMGDAQADPVAAAILDRELTRADFERVLDPGAGRPSHPALSAFVDHVRSLPPGFDMRAARRGALVYQSLPPLGATMHGVVGGFLYAAMQPNAALALATSADIAKATHKRYMRTAQYVLDITDSQALDWGGAGCASACRVRLVHGFVRTEIGRRVAWDTERYGAPIHPVSTLLAASVTGTWALAHAERMGCHYSAQEREDMAMFTALQAHYQGVAAPLIPLRYADWEELTYWALWHSGLPTIADRPKALSVLEPLLHNGYPFSQSAVMDRIFNSFIIELARRTFGDRICEYFQIPHSFLGERTYRLMRSTLAAHVAANNRLGNGSIVIRGRAQLTRRNTLRTIERTLHG